MVVLELQYLFEVNRTLQPAQALIGLLESWTRDPFDRLIVAHARSNRYAPLITSDTQIHENYVKSIWR